MVGGISNAAPSRDAKQLALTKKLQAQANKKWKQQCSKSKKKKK